MQIHRYLEELWHPLSIANKAIDKYQPWTLMKEKREDEAMALNGLIATILAKVSLMLYPVMPQTMPKIASALGFEITHESWKFLFVEDQTLGPFTIEKVPPLFPRIEEALLPHDEPASATPAQEEKKTEEAKKNKSEEKEVGLIGIDQFFQTSLKVGTVVKAEEVPKSKKLLLLQVDIGEEKPRQVVAGIKEWYTPESLLGTQVCVVANLKPAKLMGMKSEGMLLAAKDGSGLSLIRPESPKANGTPIG